MNNRGLMLLEAASYNLKQAQDNGAGNPDIRELREVIHSFIDEQRRAIPATPPPTVEYAYRRTRRPLRVKRATLWKLAAAIYLPAFAYLCGMMLAQGFINGLG